MLTFFTALLVLTIICTLLLVIYAFKKRSQPGAWYFILLAASVLLVNAGYIGELNADTVSTALFWSGLEHLFLPFHPYFWLMMCLEYTHACKHIRFVRNIMLLFPALYYVIFYTNTVGLSRAPIWQLRLHR